MFSKFRQAIFGIPLLAQAPRHASYTGPTTSTAIAQSGQAANMASTANGNTEIATLANGYVSLAACERRAGSLRKGPERSGKLQKVI